jgi:hypothetical protein
LRNRGAKSGRDRLIQPSVTAVPPRNIIVEAVGVCKNIAEPEIQNLVRAQSDAQTQL